MREMFDGDLNPFDRLDASRGEHDGAADRVNDVMDKNPPRRRG